MIFGDENQILLNILFYDILKLQQFKIKIPKSKNVCSKFLEYYS